MSVNRYNSSTGELEKIASGGQIIQVSALPAASTDEVGRIYQYIGETTSTYTIGHFYKCIALGSYYSWKQTTQDIWIWTTSPSPQVRDWVYADNAGTTHYQDPYKHKDCYAWSIPGDGRLSVTSDDGFNQEWFTRNNTKDKEWFEWVEIDTSAKPGHTIKDSSGTDMAMEPTLHFIDFDVTDNSEDSKTEIRPHEITENEWDEIVSGAPSVGDKFPIMFDESGVEYQVGLYKRADGKVKPIYRKDIQTTVGSTDTTSVDLSSVNIEKSIFSKIMILADSNINYIPLPVYNSTTGNGGCWYNREDKTLKLRTGTQYRNIPADISIFYTKTTDEWKEE